MASPARIIAENSVADDLLGGIPNVIKHKPSEDNSESGGIIGTLKKVFSGKLYVKSEENSPPSSLQVIHNHNNDCKTEINSESTTNPDVHDISHKTLERIRSTDTVELNRFLSHESVISRNPSRDICLRNAQSRDVTDDLHCPSVDMHDCLRHIPDENGIDMWALHKLNESFDSADASTPITARSNIGILRQSSRDSESGFGIMRQSSRDNRECNEGGFGLFRQPSRESDGGDEIGYSNIAIARSESIDYTDLSGISSLDLNKYSVARDFIDLPAVDEEDFADL